MASGTRGQDPADGGIKTAYNRQLAEATNPAAERTSEIRLAGKVANISGTASGMGAEEARLFAREGAKVVFTDVLDQEGCMLADENAAIISGTGSYTRPLLYLDEST